MCHERTSDQAQAVARKSQTSPPSFKTLAGFTRHKSNYSREPEGCLVASFNARSSRFRLKVNIPSLEVFASEDHRAKENQKIATASKQGLSGAAWIAMTVENVPQRVIAGTIIANIRPKVF
jgi:hypothetical protein